MNLTFGQTVKLTKTEIGNYVALIEQLKTENKLLNIGLPFGREGCFGRLKEDNLNNQLIS